MALLMVPVLNWQSPGSYINVNVAEFLIKWQGDNCYLGVNLSAARHFILTCFNETSLFCPLLSNSSLIYGAGLVCQSKAQWLVKTDFERGWYVDEHTYQS